MRITDFVINCFCNCKSQSEEKQKSMNRDGFLHIQIFQTFGNLEIDFGVNLNKYY